MLSKKARKNLKKVAAKARENPKNLRLLDQANNRTKLVKKTQATEVARTTNVVEGRSRM